VLSVLRNALFGVLLALAAPIRAAPAPSVVWLRGTDAAGRPFDLERLRGQVVVLTVATRGTAGESKQIGMRLQGIVMNGEVAVVTVVNLDDVPFFALGYARRRVAQEAARSSMVILTDDRGKLCRALALSGSDILIIDRRGQLQRRYRGAGQLDQALRTVDELRRPAVSAPGASE
jgi:hypothetical protein